MKKILQKTIYLLLLLSTFLGTAKSFGQDLNPKFFNSLIIPPTTTATDYFLRVDSTIHNFNPEEPGDTLNTLIQTYTFNEVGNEVNSILGPTIFWKYESDLSVRVRNNLNQTTTVHWHGAHVPNGADGGPHQRIIANSTWDVPPFKVLDRSATMWYHPHAMGTTYEHVQMGLSGIIIVEDPVNDPILSDIHGRIPNSYDVNDFPLIFQTKRFDRKSDGRLEIRRSFPGFKDDYVYMVNARKDPILKAPQDQIRLRVLNGDAKFAFNFGVGDRELNPSGFHLIATDAGYTTESVAMDEIMMGPGERTEWIVDLRNIPIGDTLFIYNKVSEIPSSIIGSSATTITQKYPNGFAQDRVLLAIVVEENQTGQSYNLDFPIPLHPTEKPALETAWKERIKVFRRDKFNGESLYNIDSTLMDMMVVNDIVPVDSTEIWTIDNISNRAHPFHIHDIHFWVTQIIDANGNPLDSADYPTYFSGPKDNVMVMPGWKLSVIGTFADYATPVEPQNSYMYHCHILPHEDKGMMGQFVVTDIENVPTSVRDFPILSNIPMKLYPNPADEYIILEGKSSEKSMLRFIDLQGRIIKEMRLPVFQGGIRIDTGDLKAGMIVVQWLTKKGRAVSRINIW